MTKTISAPFNLNQWIKENRHLLKPPVGNQQIFKGNDDFIVMVVGGPNSRKDFHIDLGEELFYQLEGEIELKLMLKDEKGLLFEKTIQIKEGDMFLLPSNVPHSPRRGQNTVGLVIERYRNPQENDGFQWYCENCSNLLFETHLPVVDIVNQLPLVMDQFYSSEDLCTCKNCGTKMEKPTSTP
jgi:3-hydroxyanthranilate 3,4-dioxygenase